MASEKRLIDANALDNKLETLKIRFKAQGRDTVAEDYNFVQTVLLTAPTVDAVEVVRCKNCKHWHEETGWCNEHSHFVDRLGDFCYPEENCEWKMFDADYFCKDGERKDNERKAD